MYNFYGYGLTGAHQKGKDLLNLNAREEVLGKEKSES